MLLSSNGHAIDGLWFVGQRHFPISLPYPIPQVPTSSLMKAAKSWLDAYCQGRQPSHTLLPLHLQGSDFQQQIWSLLLQIPYGKVITYGQLAQQYCGTTGVSTMSAQAVGVAVSRNPVSVIVPCHRVIGATGDLVGYAGGIETKAKLLTHEGYQITRMI